MSIFTKVYRYDVCVYWAPLTADAYGQMQLAVPVELQCRWTDAREVYDTKEGIEYVSNAKVIVSEPVLIDGMLCHASLDSLSTEQKENPRQFLSENYIIKRTKAINNLRHTRRLILAWL